MIPIVPIPFPVPFPCSVNIKITSSAAIVRVAEAASLDWIPSGPVCGLVSVPPDPPRLLGDHSTATFPVQVLPTSVWRVHDKSLMLRANTCVMFVLSRLKISLKMLSHCYCTGPGPYASDIWWSRLETCSNLFTWGPPPPPRMPTYGAWLLNNVLSCCLNKTTLSDIWMRTTWDPVLEYVKVYMVYLGRWWRPEGCRVPRAPPRGFSPRGRDVWRWWRPLVPACGTPLWRARGRPPRRGLSDTCPSGCGRYVSIHNTNVELIEKSHCVKLWKCLCF